MRVRPLMRNPFQSFVRSLILGTTVETESIRRAYFSLAPTDRDCMRYVPRLLRFVEG